jgi:type VII secretion integral membrane protein EccD
MTAVHAGPAPTTELGMLTVIAPHRRADLRLPFDTVLAGLLPELCDLLCSDQDEQGSLWVLTRQTGVRLDPTTTLSGAQVFDGDTLLLTNVDALGDAPRLTDVVEEIVVSGGRAWTLELRRAALLVAAAVVLAGGAVSAQLLAPPMSGSFALVALATGGVGVGLAGLVSRADDLRMARVVSLGALPWWAVAGAHLAQLPDPQGLARLILAGAAILLALGIQLVTVPALRPITIGLLCALTPAEVVLVIVREFGGSGRTLAAVLILVWTIVLPYAPRISAVTSGLAALARPLSNDGSALPPGADAGYLDRDAVETKVGLARHTLVTVLLTSGVGIAVCWVGLLVAGWSNWSPALIGLCTAMLLLRAPQHQQAGEVLALTGPALVGVVLFAVGGIEHWGGAMDRAPTVGVVALLLTTALVGACYLDRVPHDVVALRLALRRAEIAVRIAVIVVGVGATGSYALVFARAATLGRHL